jgi:anti-anti-sigma factor
MPFHRGRAFQMMDPHVFAVERHGNTLVVLLLCEVSALVAEDVAVELNAILQQMEPSGPKNLVIDFGGIAYFDSSLLNAIVKLSRRLHDGKLVFCNLSTFGREVLQITRLDTLWPICNSRAEALKTIAEG